MTKPQKIEKALDLIDKGSSVRKAASEINTPHNTLDYWLKKLDAAEGDYDLAFNSKKSKGGRPAKFFLTNEEACIAKYHRLCRESLDEAAWDFSRDERVSPAVRAQIRHYEDQGAERGKRPMWPHSLHRAFRVTNEEKAAFRGAKHKQQTEMITRRGMFEVLSDGTTRDILPGDVWELDDYSTNQPYTFTDANTGEVHVGRQVLAARDLASASWLGFEHVGRERDAYRGEDILRFIERLIQSHGVPKVLRLERGVWDSDFIHGIKVDGFKKRWGALDKIMRIEHVYKSKGKAIIEGGFNVLQRRLSQTGTDIGRYRGEFEAAAKKLRQAKATNKDPRTLGFLTLAESSEKHEIAARHINSKPMTRGHLNERISPDDLKARHGWHTSPLTEENQWVFLPYKQRRVVRAGQVAILPGGGWPEMYFTVNGVTNGVHLETGHKIIIACDPARPDKGAYIFNADNSVRNREAYGMGELLMVADYDGLAPQFNASGNLSPHQIKRKKASAAAHTSFRAIVEGGTGRRREVSRTDGRATTQQASTIQRQETENPTHVETSPALNPRTRRKETAPKISRFSRHDTAAKRAAEIAKLTKQYQEQ